jgi:hypothetical protein
MKLEDASTDKNWRLSMGRKKIMGTKAMRRLRPAYEAAIRRATCRTRNKPRTFPTVLFTVFLKKVFVFFKPLILR